MFRKRTIFSKAQHLFVPISIQGLAPQALKELNVYVRHGEHHFFVKARGQDFSLESGHHSNQLYFL